MGYVEEQVALPMPLYSVRPPRLLVRAVHQGGSKPRLQVFGQGDWIARHARSKTVFVEAPLDHVRRLPDLTPQKRPVDLVGHREGAVFLEIDVEALLLCQVVWATPSRYAPRGRGSSPVQSLQARDCPALLEAQR